MTQTPSDKTRRRRRVVKGVVSVTWPSSTPRRDLGRDDVWGCVLSFIMSQSQSDSLTIAGERQTGDDVRSQNVTAALAIANVVKSSLGPVGLDKMLVDDIGDITITNDGATILGQLEVEHPAAKVLVELAGLQDQVC